MQPQLKRLSRPSVKLSPQQARVLDCRKIGMTYKEIASDLAISINTVRYHIRVILAKTGARSSAEAILLVGELSI